MVDLWELQALTVFLLVHVIYKKNLMETEQLSIIIVHYNFNQDQILLPFSDSIFFQGLNGCKCVCQKLQILKMWYKISATLFWIISNNIDTLHCNI